MTTASVDTVQLEAKVKEMYRHVAQEPGGDYHFELGERLALRVGYDPSRLQSVPAGAVESFAGVGYFFDLAALAVGESVVDLGSGSGMDALVAADYVGPTGRVVGIDFTLEQLEKSRQLAAAAAADHVEFIEGRIENIPLTDASMDCVISNGVINLAPDKNIVFAEAARVLRPSGRLAIADIITEKPLTEAIVCSADLWASCIGGAAEQEAYLQAIESAGFRIDTLRVNAYAFLSDQARNASATYGVKSISLLATKSSSGPSSRSRMSRLLATRQAPAVTSTALASSEPM